jgi:uncharacterized protein (TIGR00255 family)
MIRSMTGYGRGEAAGARVMVAAECKSVNHRHLDIALKFPRALAPLEGDARRLVQSAIQRGRVDVTVTLAPAGGGTLNPPTVNIALAQEYADIARALADELRLVGGPTLLWLLDRPGVLSREEQPALSLEEAWPLLEASLSRALGELVARREAEGQALREELRALHAGVAAQVEVMSMRAPVAAERRGARLGERIRSMLGEAGVDQARVATEVAVWAEKTDVSEELARLRAHLDQFAHLLDQGGAIGRTLDFLIQETNREVNTVGSKADDLEVSQAVIAAKSALEKLREQAQNIE